MSRSFGTVRRLHFEYEKEIAEGKVSAKTIVKRAPYFELVKVM